MQLNLDGLRHHKHLFLITIAYFSLGFVNIHFALLGLICMILPMILLFRNRKRTWCQGYCPRASLYNTCGKSKKWKSQNIPRSFIHGNVKWWMLAYFGISLTLILLSTVAVARGLRPALEQLRFLIVFLLPFDLPQLLIMTVPFPWITHLSYRFYSMMMTTTVLGLILALVYKPRTWCTICPIATVSGVVLKKINA